MAAYQTHSRCAPCESRFSGMAVELYTGGQRQPVFRAGAPGVDIHLNDPLLPLTNHGA